MSLQELQEFQLVKYQQNDIQFFNKLTRTLYKYYQATEYQPIPSNINHPLLRKSIPTKNGYFLPIQSTNLEKQIQIRRKFITKKNFQQIELINTFLPVIEYIRSLHSHRIYNLGLTLQSIIIDDQGLLKIKDLRHKSLLSSDSNNNRDYQALGYMLLECSSLKTQKQLKQNQKLEEVLRSIGLNYSKGFILSIYVLIKKMSNYYLVLQELLQNNEQMYGKFEELREIYNRIVVEKQSETSIQKCKPNLLEKQTLRMLQKQQKLEKQKKITFTPILTHSQQIEELVSKKIGQVKKIVELGNMQNNKLSEAHFTKTYQHQILERNRMQTIAITKKVNDSALKKMSNRKPIINRADSQVIRRNTKESTLKEEQIKRLESLSKKRTYQE